MADYFKLDSFLAHRVQSWLMQINEPSNMYVFLLHSSAGDALIGTNMGSNPKYVMLCVVL